MTLYQKFVARKTILYQTQQNGMKLMSQLFAKNMLNVIQKTTKSLMQK